MLIGGYVKLYRSLLEWEWYQDTNTKTVFIHLLLTANYEDKNWKGITIHRGQKVTSYQNLANELNMSIQNIRTAIKHLVLTGEITNNQNAKYSLITIKNYDKFQEVTSNLTDSQQSDNKQLTSNQQATNNNGRKIRNKESKKDKNNNIDFSQMIDEFTQNDELKKVIDEFIQHRENIKKALTELALKKILNQLRKWNYTDQQCIECLNNSIMNGWQGVFELKKNAQQNNFTNNIQRLMQEAKREDEQRGNNTNTDNFSF